LRRWWDTVGRHRYPDTDRLLICADGGGSNGYRVRAWKIELTRFAAETGLTITVCHLPPGTSKWSRGRDRPHCDTRSHVMSELVEEVRRLSKT
jgi:hypothetical protein